MSLLVADKRANILITADYIILSHLLGKADHFALLCVLFPCVFVTFPYDVSGQVWDFIVLIPDLCFLL